MPSVSCPGGEFGFFNPDNPVCAKTCPDRYSCAHIAGKEPAEPQQSALIFELPARSKEEEIADLETAIPELKTQLENMEQRLVTLKRERERNP